MGKKLSRYRIKAKKIRLPEGKLVNGYERQQFQDAWSRYLRPPPESKQEQPVQPEWANGLPGLTNRNTDAAVPVSKSPSNPHGQTVVPVVPVSEAGEGAKGGDSEPPPERDPGYRDDSCPW
jgi:Protein of unknown function (DUF3631)